MIRSGRETLPDVWEWSGDQPRGLGMVGTPSRMSLRVGRPSQMSRSFREALPDVQELSEGLPR